MLMNTNSNHLLKSSADVHWLQTQKIIVLFDNLLLTKPVDAIHNCFVSLFTYIVFIRQVLQNSGKFKNYDEVMNPYYLKHEYVYVLFEQGPCAFVYIKMKN